MGTLCLRHIHLLPSRPFSFWTFLQSKVINPEHSLMMGTYCCLPIRAGASTSAKSTFKAPGFIRLEMGKKALRGELQGLIQAPCISTSSCKNDEVDTESVSSWGPGTGCSLPGLDCMRYFVGLSPIIYSKSLSLIHI